MNGRVKRGERILERLERAGLTETGKNWIIQMVDPFHDRDLEHSGFPDVTRSASIVQLFKKSITINKNAALPAGNWDVNIFTTPAALSLGQSRTGAQQTNTIIFDNAAATSDQLGILTMIQGGSGTDLSYNGLLRTGANFGQTLGFTGFDAPFQSNCRVVGLGFEVHNTTAQLTVQGSACVYRQPQPTTYESDTTTLWRGNTVPGAAQGAQTLLTADQPVVARTYAMSDAPATIADALLLNGSRQWEAKDGCMVVSTLNSINNPVQTPDGANISIIGSVITTTGTAWSTSYPVNLIACPTSPVISGIVTAPANMLFATRAPSHLCPFNTGGVFFTGLSDTTTLTVNLNVYVERFPITGNNPDLLVLAKPSPCYDPMALEIYTQIMQQLPPGCKVNMNADGDWFWEALSGLADVVMPVLSAIPHPLAQGIGLVGGSLNASYKSSRKPAARPESAPWTNKKAIEAPPQKSVKNKNAKLANRQRGGKGAISGPFPPKPNLQFVNGQWMMAPPLPPRR